MRPALSPRLFLAALAGAALTGCAVGPNFQRPSPDLPPTLVGAGSSATVAPSPVTAQPMADPAHWWTAFNDAELTALILRAQAANLDARQAVLRVAEAHAQRDAAAAALWPSLNANASADDIRLSETTPTGALFSKIGEFPGLSKVSIPNPYAQYQLGLDASWELDLFGRVRRTVEAAKANQQAAARDSDAVMVATLGAVGAAYVDLRGTQARRAVLVDSLATANELADLAGQRSASGLGNQIDLAQAQAQARLAEAQIPLLDRQITADINQLSLLLALKPGALRGELETAAPAPPTPPTVPIGLASELARRRPDIAAAEARLHAAIANQGVAVADLYPRVTLGVQTGLQSDETATLTAWASRFLTAGPQIELPLFDAGQRRAAVRLADVHAQEAALAYRGVVLGALHEVDNALAAYGTDQQHRLLLAAAVAQNRDALDLTRQRYAAGVASYVDVLNAQRTLQQNQLALTDATSAVSSDLVLLYKTLGGGWG